jgi:hypothetical protein
LLVQFKVSTFGFPMQDSSDFKFFPDPLILQRFSI